MHRIVGDDRGPAHSSRAAEFEYGWQKLSDLAADGGEDVGTLADGIGDVERLVGAEVRAQQREIPDRLRVHLGHQPRRLCQGESAVEPLWGEFEYRVTMCPAHREDKISPGRDLPGELTSHKTVRIAAEVTQHLVSMRMDGMADHGMGSGAGSGDGCVNCGRVRRGESLCGGGPTDVAGAHE